jgi:uncharacterized protein
MTKRARRPTPAPATPSAPDAPDQLTICTKLCGGRCCRYVTVSVPAPRSEPDWDEVRWWLAHQGVMVTRDPEGWMLHVMTPCTNLKPDSSCGVYPDHMLACQEHDATDCEYTGEVPFDVKLESETDLADYLERRRLKRGREVAKAIRRAAARRSLGARTGGLVSLAPLAPPSRS